MVLRSIKLDMSYRQDLSYQGGPYNEIFSSQGSSNNQTWSIPKTVSRVYEKESKGFCYSLQNSQKLLFPLNKKPANLVHPFLILQIFCSLGNLINIELSTSDMQLNKRRFIFSSHIKDIKVTPLHVMLPVSFIKHGVWINLCIDLHHLVSSCFKNTTFKSLDSIQINGVFKLRKIFTLKDSITDTSGDFDTFGLHIVDVPKALSFSHGVEFINQLVDFNRISADSVSTICMILII